MAHGIQIDVKAMRGSAVEASNLLKSLANPHRLLILCQLAGGERSVGELASFLGIRDTVASQHLALLRKDELVAGRRDGQTVWYSLADTPARAVLETLYRIYCASPPRRSARKPESARR